MPFDSKLTRFDEFKAIVTARSRHLHPTHPLA